MPSARELASQLADELRRIRRELHRIPEVGNSLPLTRDLVLRELEGLDVEILAGEALSSLTLVLRGSASRKSGAAPVVLLRGDMDALPLAELSDVPYRSTHPGVMHACGHDLHTAALLGALKILHQLRSELAGDVVFMFQPGEEGPGGAEPMIAEGVLDAAGRRADAGFGLHVFSSGHPRGIWYGRPGPQTAAVDELTVRFIGTGGHGSRPHQANDPIPALCEAVLALQTMVTRSFDVFDPVVLTVGRISGGTRDAIIPEYAGFDATVRTFSAASRDTIERKSVALARGIAAAHGLDAEVEYTKLYPVLINAEPEFALARQTAIDLFGEGRFREMLYPDSVAEDFAYIAAAIPSAFLFLSACSEENASGAPSNHSAYACFDDSVLPDAALWLAEVAMRRLSSEH